MTLREVLAAVLQGEDVGDVDEDLTEYCLDAVEETEGAEAAEEVLRETIAPLLESAGAVEDYDAAMRLCDTVLERFASASASTSAAGFGSSSSSSTSAFGNASAGGRDNDDGESAPRLLDAPVHMGRMAEEASEEQKAQSEWLLGIDKIRAQKNEEIEISDALSNKAERRAEREQQRWLDMLERQFAVGSEDDPEAPTNQDMVTMIIPDQQGVGSGGGGGGGRDIHVPNISLNFSGQDLLDNADLRFVHGRRYGLCGRNGVGKTTLLRNIALRKFEGLPAQMRILHAKQEVHASDRSVMDVVLEADIERRHLLNREAALLARQAAREKASEPDADPDPELSTTRAMAAPSTADASHPAADDADNDTEAQDVQEDQEELRAVYQRLEEIGAHTARARAASILSGLQFTPEMQQAPTSSLSGGWLMRVALASALLIEPECLLLDEPTNHLDLEAVMYLQEYLKNYKHTLLLVSHDRVFLNEVCTDIILFQDKTLQYYRGNYDTFEMSREEQLKNLQRKREAQILKRQHMQEFVDKFRYSAKRASLVQSRIKAMEKMEEIEPLPEEVDFHFTIDAPEGIESIGRGAVQLEGVSFGYGAKGMENALFKDVHLGVDVDSRVALVGRNGSGKSTLLKILAGDLQPLQGHVHRAPRVRVAKFTQHHLDLLNERESAVQNMYRQFPSSTEFDLRAFLGRFQISGDDALKPVAFLSGGMKSRVVLACLAFARPSIILFDEPTNHLDIGIATALVEAITNFPGGVLVISHDQHFVQQVCNELWIVEDKQVQRFNGTFDQYKSAVLERTRTEQAVVAREAAAAEAAATEAAKPGSAEPVVGAEGVDEARPATSTTAAK